MVRYLIILFFLCVLVYTILTFWAKNKYRNIIKFNPYVKIKDQILLVTKKGIIPKKLRFITPIFALISMIVIFVISFSLLNIYIKVVSASLILSIPITAFPIIFMRLLLNREKNKINQNLPMYVVNLKNHVSEDNNIIKAIQNTTVEEPLCKYISAFKNNIKRGINVIEAFEILKKEVNVKNFTSLVNSCEACYLNGGDFTKLLDQYINMITKENTQKESSKEKAYSDILTLIIMSLLNIFVIVSFVFPNKEYANIIRETFLGRAILSFNAISYLIIMFLVSRMYKEE